MDTVGDFLTSLRNAIAVSKSEIIVHYSKIRWAIASILKEEGYLDEVKKAGKTQSRLIIKPTYYQKTPVIQSIKRISSPGLRIYRQAKDLRINHQDKKTLIISTPRGTMTAEEAKKRHLGGEVICQVE